MVAMATMATFLAEWSILALWRWHRGGASRLLASDREARGMKLLREWLSPKQLQSFDRHGHFDIIGSETATRYRIHTGTALNIEQLKENGRPFCAWCVVPKGELVAGDVMLAQKIALETDERATLSVAIRYPGARSRMMFDG
jgi:hypothetical protein